MGIDPRKFSDKQVDLISDPAQRAAVVKARGLGETLAVRKAEVEAATEEAMHDDYIAFLRRHKLPYIHASMKKRSTIQKGCPDFTVTGGARYGYKSMYVEFKLPGNKLSPEQVEYIGYLEDCGCYVVVAYSFQRALSATMEFYGLAA